MAESAATEGWVVARETEAEATDEEASWVVWAEAMAQAAWGEAQAEMAAVPAGAGLEGNMPQSQAAGYRCG